MVKEDVFLGVIMETVAPTVGRALPSGVTMESYCFAAVPFQSVYCTVPVFVGHPGGSPSPSLSQCGRAARTECLGSRGLLQSHKHTALCSGATTPALQPASLAAALIYPWQKASSEQQKPSDGSPMTQGDHVWFSALFPQSGQAVAMDNSLEGDVGIILASIPIPQGKAWVRAMLSLASSIVETYFC